MRYRRIKEIFIYAATGEMSQTELGSAKHVNYTVHISNMKRVPCDLIIQLNKDCKQLRKCETRVFIFKTSISTISLNHLHIQAYVITGMF
jgi:hypothetical protein